MKLDGRTDREHQSLEFVQGQVVTVHPSWFPFLEIFRRFFFLPF